jgi:riboflavin-specific deaminase-like protein
MDHIQTWLAEIETHRQKCGRPLVTLSYAQSLDGCITLRRGQPLALSGDESLIITHRLRAAHQAILVGIGTILADNPRLNVRLVEGRNPQPVVLDSQLRFPEGSRLLDGPQLPWIATTRCAPPEKRATLESAGVHLLEIPEDRHHRIQLPALLEQLASLGIDSLMVEGGAQVITSFLSERLVDRIVLTIAPRFLGGLHALEGCSEISTGPTLSATSPTSRPDPVFPRLKSWQAERVGEDLLIWGVPDWEAPNAGQPSQTPKVLN